MKLDVETKAQLYGIRGVDEPLGARITTTTTEAMVYEDAFYQASEAVEQAELVRGGLVALSIGVGLHALREVVLGSLSGQLRREAKGIGLLTAAAVIAGGALLQSDEVRGAKERLRLVRQAEKSSNGSAQSSSSFEMR